MSWKIPKKILEMRIGATGGEEFKIQWENSPRNTWLPLASLPNQELLRAFDAEIFEVEAIQASKNERGQKLFLVLWKGYPQSEATWEPRSSFGQSHPILKAFEEKEKADRAAASRKRSSSSSQAKKSRKRK